MPKTSFFYNCFLQVHAVDSCGFYNVTNAVDGLFCQWCRWWHLSYHQWPSIFGNYFEHLSLGGSSLHSVRDHGDFSTQMLPKVMQQRVLKRHSGLHCVIFLWFWYCNWPLILRWKNYEIWSACYHAIGTSTVSSSFRGHSVCCIMQIDADRYICY